MICALETKNSPNKSKTIEATNLALIVKIQLPYSIMLITLEINGPKKQRF